MNDKSDKHVIRRNIVFFDPSSLAVLAALETGKVAVRV